MATKANTPSKKTSTKSTAAKGSSAKASSKKAAEAPARSYEREIWAAVCFFVGFFSFIGYFKVDALFITYFCATIKGFIGYGYWLLPPALIVCAVILAFHKGKPVRLRSISLVLVPVVFGALVHALFCKMELSFASPIQLIKDLYAGGRELTCGGLISGLLGYGFEELFSIWGAAPVFLLVMVVLVMIAFKITFRQGKRREKAPRSG